MDHYGFDIYGGALTGYYDQVTAQTPNIPTVNNSSSQVNKFPRKSVGSRHTKTTTPVYVDDKTLNYSSEEEGDVASGDEESDMSDSEESNTTHNGTSIFTQLSDKFNNINLPKLSHRLYPPTLDSGLFFNLPIPLQFGGWTPWIFFIHVFLVFIFIFGLGDFMSLRNNLAEYVQNYFVLWILLIAFCFMFVGLSTSVASATLILALTCVSKDVNPTLKFIMLLSSVIHLILITYRTPDLFSDYDLAFIIVYIISLCCIDGNINKPFRGMLKRCYTDQNLVPPFAKSTLLNKQITFKDVNGVSGGGGGGGGGSSGHIVNGEQARLNNISISGSKGSQSYANEVYNGVGGGENFNNLWSNDSIKMTMN